METYFFSPFDPACLEEKRAESSKEANLGERFRRKRKEGNSRLWAVVHLVPGLGGRDAVLAVENDVFLLGFVDVRPVDLLRDSLQFLIGYGITAVGKALYEELGKGCLRARGRTGGSNCLYASPLGIIQKLVVKERGCSQVP